MKTQTKYLQVFAGALGLMAGLAATEAKAGCGNTGGPNLNRLDRGQLTIIAHRGLWGSFQGGGGAPENSDAALDNAVNSCVDGVEFDVKMTRDSTAVIMHDFNLGRTTNIWQNTALCRGQGEYNPQNNSGCNLPVSSVTSRQFEALHLLSPSRSSVTGYFAPGVISILARHAQDIRNGRNPGPIIFDIKTADAVRAVYYDSYDTFQTYGLGFSYQPAAKVNATLYGTPAAYHADAPNDTYLKPIPVFTTNMLNNINVATAVNDWDPYATEINVKQANKFLQGELDHLKNLGTPTGVFQAIPDGPGGRYSGRFYNNDGSCCYTLASKYTTYNGETETQDNRGNPNFLKQEGFTFITTDDPIGLGHSYGR